MEERRAVCLNCIDGRIQLPTIYWIKETYKIDFVDMITEPGMDGILANESRDISDLTQKVRLSIQRNNALMIFVVSHHDCRGNPVSGSTHKEQIIAAVERLKKDFLTMDVFGLWVNEMWEVERVVKV